MKRTLVIAVTASGVALAAPASAVPVYGLLSDNSLITFDSASPGTTSTPVTILGLGAGEAVRGIDLRPRDGQLYGAVSQADGTGARIVTINPITGTTTAVAPLLNGNGGVITPGANPVNFIGQRVGVDFNPQVDLLRVVSDQEQNIAINPGNRAAGGQAGTTRVDGNLNLGGQPTPDLNVNGAAYTNNRDGAPSTLLYTIDTVSDLLYLQNPPNGGTQTNPQTLGVNAVGRFRLRHLPDRHGVRVVPGRRPGEPRHLLLDQPQQRRCDVHRHDRRPVGPDARDRHHRGDDPGAWHPGDARPRAGRHRRPAAADGAGRGLRQRAGRGAGLASSGPITGWR